ncbi:MAG: putative SOS response-associated peptidase YedK [Marinoscillum sp.]|jgi:putative SOS response-associated peptidase YedK
MCYDSETTIRRQLREAINLGAPEDEIDALKKKMILIERKKGGREDPSDDNEFNDEELPQYFHVSGFAHPNLSFITSLHPTSVDCGIWGFIPRWVKTLTEAYNYKKPYNSNLNAQSEGMFESRAFKYAARYRRCIIHLDAYYEYHHQNKTTYPFRIYHKEEKPLWVAGIFELNELLDEKTGEILYFNSFGILTCTANPMLSKIHNNPKMISRTGRRMLVILDESQLADYLAPYPNSHDPIEEALFDHAIVELCQPYDEDLLNYDPVRNLKRRKGLEYLGNVPEIREVYHWPDLDLTKITG